MMYDGLTALGRISNQCLEVTKRKAAELYLCPQQYYETWRKFSLNFNCYQL